MEKDKLTDQKKKEIEKLAGQLLKLARDTITVRFRFFDAALHRIKIDYWYGLKGICLRGQILSIDPVYLLKAYSQEEGIAVRMYLHILMHFIFMHAYAYDKTKQEFWDIATDLAVENIILDMNFTPGRLSRDGLMRDKLTILKKRVPVLTAEKIYKEFLIHDISNDLKKQYQELFTLDLHSYWHEEKAGDEVLTDEDDLRRLARRIRTELKAFSRGKATNEAMEKNLDDAIRVRVNYREVIERFMTNEEEITVNDDEFDYIYYTYGLKLYHNLPLVEPLEYRENKKIKDFVIALDTSASCQGETIKKFLTLTYSLMKNSENFFHKINVHIVQCDNTLQMDTKITCDADFEEFIKNGKIKGFGDTDFAPVFTYVDALKKRGEFTNLKGLIYFTDGYGFYPEKMPDYDVIFAFLNEDEKRPQVPGWAMKVIMEDELNEY